MPASHNVSFRQTILVAIALLLPTNTALTGAAVPSNQLGGPQRYLTHLSTDKPIYRVGETVYARGVMLNASDHSTLGDQDQSQATIEILGPKGDRVASGHVAGKDSVVGFPWPVPPDTAGGQYMLKMSFPFTGHAPAERKFDVRAYRAPRIKSQIVFLRYGFGPGDRVVATLHVTRAEGGIPEGAQVTVIGRVDGMEVHRNMTRVDAQGNCEVRFYLPAQIQRGEGTIAFIVDDGYSVETSAKTIPILLKNIDVSLYPEGGQLVASLSCRVYFEARTAAGKPADLVGLIVDEQGREVVKVKSEHEGRGRFTFMSQKGDNYLLKIVEPSGIDKTFALPAVVAHGAVLHALSDRYEPHEPVGLRVAATDDPVTLTLSKR